MSAPSFPSPLDVSPSKGHDRELRNVTHRTPAIPIVNDVRAGARNPQDRLETDEDDAEMGKIIALLEDWAAWERSLEEEAKHCEIARSIKQAADREMPQLDMKNITPHVLKEKNCATKEMENDSTEDTTSARFLNEPNDVHRQGNMTQPSPDIKRAWSREVDKFVVTEGRQALEVWTAGQTRRRSSGDIQPDKARDSQGMKEYVLSQARQKSLTVGRNRKREIRTGLNSARSKSLPPGPVGASFPHEPSFPFRRAFLNVGASATSPTLFKDRTGVSRGAWYSANTLRQSCKTGTKSTDKHIWERRASSTPPATHPSIPANWSGASAWARSPSRETAGGILVKHSFFYGNGGRACSARLASRERWAGANRCFESPWMRQFRKETERNPSWWICPQQHHEEAGKTKGRSLLRSQSQSGRRGKNCSTETKAIGTESRKENRATRRGNTSLWQEVRSYLAARECGESDNGGVGRGSVHSKGGVAATRRSQRLDDLSFGDRLRCTPLSQGAWFEDNGSREMRSGSMNALIAGGGSVYGKVNNDVREQSAEANNGRNAREVADSEMETKDRDHVVEGSKLKGANARGGRKSVMTSGVDRSRKSLRSVHDDILAKLRGEIDSATREEIVLRAAEEARGVLERDGVQSATSRRASSSSLKHTIVIPDSIDYDKVEATLSLIELASRAAGPDAGRQMLTALEALEKMQHRASVDDESVRSWSSSARMCAATRNGIIHQPKIPRGERAISTRKGKAISNSSVLPFKDNIDINQLGRENWAASDAMGAQADKHSDPDATFHDKTAAKCVKAIEAVTAKGIEVATDAKPTLVKKAAAVADDRTVPPEMITDVKMDTICSTLQEGDLVKGERVFDLEGEQARAKPPASSTSEHDTATEAGSGGMIKSFNSWLWGSWKSPSRKNSKNSDLSTNGIAGLVRVETAESIQLGVGPLKGDSNETVEKGSADQKKMADENKFTGQDLDVGLQQEDVSQDLDVGLQEDVSQDLDVGLQQDVSQDLDVGLQEDVSQDLDVGLQQQDVSQAMPKGIGDQQPKTLDVEEESKKDRLSSKEYSENERAVQVNIDADPARTMLCMEEDDAPFPAFGGTDAKDTVGKSCPGLLLAVASAGNEARYPCIKDISGGGSLGRTKSYQKTLNKSKVETGPGEAEKAEGSSSCLHKKGSWIAKGTRPQWDQWAGSLPIKDAVRGDLKLGLKKDGVEGSFSASNAWRTRKTCNPLKLSEKFVWPKSHRTCTEKCLRPPDGKRGKNTGPAGQSAPSPGIVRRSPLVDAIHPAITRQRKFQEHRQRTRRGIEMCPFDIRGNNENKKQTEFAGSLVDTAPVPGDAPPKVASTFSMSGARGTSLRAREPYREREKITTAPPHSSSFVNSDCTTSSSSSSSSTDGERGFQGLTLTDQQIGRVESWMAQARGLLGPKAWECLGSSGTFHRARNRVRMALRLESPCNDEANDLDGWRGMVSAGVATTMVEGYRRKMKSFGACRKRSPQVDAAIEKDYMATNLVLAAEAVIWIFAAERERSNICDAVTRERSRLTISRCGRIVTSNEVLSGGTLESLPVSTELGISLYKARKFVKATKLIDGFYVLEADIDLGFKRWERDARERETNASVAIGLGAANSSSAGIRGRSPPKRTRLCEVVGCSEVARYGDIQPTSTARVCRAHKHDGMVDIGSQRCARPDCGRLAVRVGNRAVTSVALCTLHAREGRLDVEGMSFVLLGLATAMLNRARRRPVSSRVEGGPESPGVTRENRDQMRHQTTIYAVRNTLLALTDQPLVMHNSPSEPPKPISSAGYLRTLPDDVVSTGCTASHLTIAAPTSANKRSLRTMDCVKLGILANGDISPSRISREACKDMEPPLGNKRISWGSNHYDSTGPPQNNLHFYAVDYEKSAGIRCQRSPIFGEITMSDQVPDTDFSSDVGAMKTPTENRKIPVETLGEAAVTPPGRVCGRGDSPLDAANLENGDGGADDRSWPFGVQEVFRRNVRSLTAIFDRYSRSLRDNRKAMALPDILRFCDVFELRPSLVSTREILDVFTSIALPGEIGLTDHKIGYRNQLTKQGAAKQSLEEEEIVPPESLPPSSQNIRTERKRSGDNNAGDTPPMPDDIEEDDECSVYFRSDSGSGNLMRVSSRRASTASSGSWSRRKRTVYIGRLQRFPLRSVDSSLSPGDRGFGLSGVSPDTVLGRRRESSLSSGSSRRSSSLSRDISIQEGEAIEPPVVPGLAMNQFFYWLSRLAMGSSALAESKTLHQASAARVRKEVKRASSGGGRGRSRDGSLMKRDVARAVTLLQWMDVSRGMKRDNIPPFNLSLFVSRGPLKLKRCLR